MQLTWFIQTSSDLINTQIKLALSGDKRRSLIRILLRAMFLEGHIKEWYIVDRIYQ